MARGTKKTVRTSEAPDLSMKEMALSIFDRVRRIKERDTASSRRIDALEKEIRDRMVEIRKLIDGIEAPEDRELVSVLVINGIKRTADEVLVD